MKQVSGKWKVVWTAALMILMATVLFACSNNGQNNTPSASTGSGGAGTAGGSVSGQQEAGDGKIAPDGITFTWAATDRSWAEGPIRDDWPTFIEMEEKTGVKIKFESIPNEGANEKKQIMMATNSVTDFFQGSGADFRLYGPDGVFLNLKDYLDIAPNLKKFYEDNPDAAALATGTDGGMYYIPQKENDEGSGRFNYVWYIRDDLMKQHNLQAPSNTEEFYQLLKSFKELYPDSHPLTFRLGLNGLTGMFTIFGRAYTGIEGFINLDPEQDKFVFSLYDERYKDALVYMNRLYAEGLLDPEFALITSAQWYERLQNGQSMVSYFWKRSLLTVNEAGKDIVGDNFDMYMIPPFTAEGVDNYIYGKPNFGNGGFGISGNVKDKEKAVRFLDYLVSEEGTNYLSLGIEGESYTYKDGVPVFLEAFGDDPITAMKRDYGVAYDGIAYNLSLAEQAWENGFAEREAMIEDVYRPYTKSSPRAFVKNTEELELEKSKLDNLTQYLLTELTKFVMGDTPITDENYQKVLDQAKKLGVDELVEMNNQAYERAYGSGN